VSPAHTQPQLTTTDIQSPSSNITSVTNAQTQCIFFSLAPELRNTIYQYVFGTGVVEGYIQTKDSLDLAPQSDLIITCRRIHDEATSLHQAATTTYWAANVFRYTTSIDLNLPVYTAKRVKHMTRIICHYDLGPVHIEFGCCYTPTPGHCGIDLVYQREISPRAPAGSMSYQPICGLDDRENWWPTASNHHHEDDCEGDDICNIGETCYKHGSLGKGKFDSLAKLW
jgi:hypothetical protein